MSRLEKAIKRLTDDELLGIKLNKKLYFKYSRRHDEGEKKIKTVQKAIRDIFYPLLDALKTRGSTHAHKKNMVWGMHNLLHMLVLEFIPAIGKIEEFLKVNYLKEIKKARELFEPIFEIVSKDWNHWEQRNLLRPYLFPFSQCCIQYDLRDERYDEYVEELETFLNTHPVLQDEKIEEEKKDEEIDDSLYQESGII